MSDSKERYQPGDALRHFWARWEADVLERVFGTKELEARQECIATTLMSAGVVLIPSDHLKDNEYVVSRGVYEAAKRVTERSKDETTG